MMKAVVINEGGHSYNRAMCLLQLVIQLGVGLHIWQESCIGFCH